LNEIELNSRLNDDWILIRVPQEETFKKLENLIQSSNKYCFLAGSGVSQNPPSNLPSGARFTGTILEKLIPKEEFEVVKDLTNSERKNMRNPNDFLRFEELMQYLQFWDPDLNVLDIYAECKIPNQAHRFLANMLTLNHHVFTTNFDSLIEYALKDLDIPTENIFPIIHPKDWEKSLKDYQYKIYKLHGSLIDTRNGKDCRKTLQATISQISKQKGNIFQLESWKLKILNLILKDCDLIVLGYSGLDDFDILPTLWKIKSNKKILWINHNEKLDYTNAQIDIVIRRHSNLEFESLSDSNNKRVGKNLLAFIRYGIRQPSQIFLINVNTNSLIERIWKRYLNEDPPTLKNWDTKPIEISLPNKLELKECEKWYLTSFIFRGCHLSQSKILQSYENSLNLAREEKNLEIQIATLNNLGKLLVAEGNIKKGLKYFEEARDLSEIIKNDIAKASSLTNIANIYVKNNPKKALKDYQESLRISKDMKNQNEQIIDLTNIAMTYFILKDISKSVDYIQEAYKLAKQIGNTELLINTIGEIAKIHLSLNQHEDALDRYQEALKLSEQMGYLSNQYAFLKEIGTLFKLKKQFKNALEYLNRAQLIADQLGAPEMKAVILNVKGGVFEDQKDWQKALNLYNQAYDIFHQMNDSSSKGNTLHNKAAILTRLNREKEAFEAYQEALEYYEVNEDKERQIITTYYMAIMFCEFRKLRAGLKYAEKAYKMVLELDDQDHRKQVLLDKTDNLYKMIRNDLYLQRG